MKSPKSFGKPKRPHKRPRLIVRRVVGTSMLPALRPGYVIVGASFRRLRPGELVVIHHDGLEKVKRIQQMRFTEVFVTGDNPAESTDSRSFGWLPVDAVVAKVIWPRRHR